MTRFIPALAAALLVGALAAPVPAPAQDAEAPYVEAQDPPRLITVKSDREGPNETATRILALIAAEG
jgi:hypothetical protein